MLDVTRATIERINAATEEWCKKALARGPGFRLWRSDMRSINDVTGYRVVHDFQILPPDAPAPGSGMIFGPWPNEFSNPA